MSPPGVQVEPARLERVAGDVEILREDQERAGRAVESAATELGRKLPGWRLARITEHNAFAWHDDARLVEGWLERYATALERCAQDYRYQDEVTAEAIALFPRIE